MIVVRAPFRLPLGGGGTDLPVYADKYGGSLVTAAINKYMFVSVNRPAAIPKIKLTYSTIEVVDVDRIDDIKHDLVRETLKELSIKEPLEISSMADLSAGTGMGSSGAYTVALVKALTTLQRRSLSPRELAELACFIEMVRARHPVGRQDQYASALGGIQHLEIDQQGHTTATALRLRHETIKELEYRLLMFYTNITRDASTILAEQEQRIQQEGAALEAMHTIKSIGIAIRDALLRGDVSGVGRLMHHHWLEKKRVSARVSAPQIDEWYEFARKHGALGGKVMGAGGGGFLLLCAEEEARPFLRKRMEEMGLTYMDFHFDFEGAKVLTH